MGYMFLRGERGEQDNFLKCRFCTELLCTTDLPVYFGRTCIDTESTFLNSLLLQIKTYVVSLIHRKYFGTSGH